MNVTKQLYQWDTGQKLTECTGIYVDYLIGDEVYRVEITDGTCIIPDELLQTSGRYKVWECMADNTLREFAFKVLPRPIPPNYVFTPTEQLTFEGLVQKETNKFNTNAIEKLNAYNANADNRVAEFNAQTGQIQADVSELKSDLSELKDGFQSVDEFATFINGSDYQGSFEDKKYRVVTENIISLDRDITLTVKNGFKFGVHLFVNNVFSSEFGWITSNHIIPSGSMFKIIIARTSENTSEIADIATFCSNVILQSDIDYKIEVNRKNIDKNYLLIKNLETGKDSLYEYGTFIRGSLYQSNLENKKYRISSETVVHFGRDVELTIADGFRITIEYYNADGTYRSGEDSGWLTGTVTILADKYVKFIIARTSENTSEIADIATFVEAVSFSNETNYRLTKLENSIHHDYVETPWIQEIHRGLTSDTIPENTIPSFLEVAKNGFKQFECDVRKTSDGILVMSHDAEFNGYVVAETNYETLNSVVISTDSVYGEIHIAKFEDVLKVAYFNDLTINIDIKDSSAINDVVNMVIANGMSGRAIYNPNTGETSVGLAIMEIDKRATVIYPYNKDNIENYYPQAFVDKSKIIICIPYYNMTNEAMDVIRASGFKSLIYDVLNSTWFEKRPDIIEYRTASASTINELNKTYLDGIIY